MWRPKRRRRSTIARMNEPDKKLQTKRVPIQRRPIRWLLRQAERFLAVIGLASILYLGCFDYSRIVSESMRPTLQGSNWDEGDRVVTEKVSYRFRRPRRWEVITIRADHGGQIMKRVVGLPGERVRMLRGGAILIDGGVLTA